MKSALEEVEALRRLFRATLKHFSASVETDLDRLKSAIAAKTEGGKTALAPELIHDARDMVTLVRTLDIKPEKGRRRDLKKMGGVIEDLQKIVEKW